MQFQVNTSISSAEHCRVPQSRLADFQANRQLLIRRGTALRGLCTVETLASASGDFEMNQAGFDNRVKISGDSATETGSVVHKPAKVPLAPATEQVPIAVAVWDIAADEFVAQEDVAQVLVPKEWVTSSYVKADSAVYIIGQRVRLPVMQGDLFTWPLFDFSTATLSEHCARATGQLTTAAEQVARSRQVLLERPKQNAPARP